jgi:hypothetical protein
LRSSFRTYQDFLSYVTHGCRKLTLIRELLASNIKAGVTCDPALCMAVDVFSGKVYRAKNRQKKLLNSVESSCDEVAAVWPNVKPPKDYYGPPILAA